MGMGYSAAFAEVIEEKAIQKTCPQEFKAFQDLLSKYDVSLADLYRNTEFQEPLVGRDKDDDEQVEKDLTAAYKALKEAFDKSSGLDLALGFHDAQDTGDRYDDVDGAYWWVDGMYQLSPAGKNMNHTLPESSSSCSVNKEL